MTLQLLYLVTILWLAFVASHAAISPEVYWKVKLPNTQIPKVIKDFLPQTGTVDEAHDLKRGDISDTKEKVDYGLRKNAILYWHRSATEDEVRDLKSGDSPHTKEKVDYGLRKNAILYWHSPATKDEVRDLKRGDSPDTKEKVDYGLRKNAILYWHRSATEDEVRDLKRGDSPDTKEKVDYGLRKNAILYWHRPATEDEVRDLKRGDSPDTKEKVDYGLRKNAILYWHRPATEDDVRDLKLGDSPDTKEKVDYGLRKNAILYWHRPATEDEVRGLKRGDSPDTKENVDYGLRKNAILYWHRAANDDEVRGLKQQSLSMDQAATNNYLRQVTEGSNAKNDLKNDFVYIPFFLEKDLEKGKVINFPPLKNKNNKEPFLPRQFVESIPFSSDKIPQILNQFSIEGSSKDAQDIKETIEMCEFPEKKGEKKKCATSLESMVDLSISVLGTNNITAVSTEVEGEIQMIQEYTMKEVRLVADGDNMVCHKLNYAYAVHYCHAGGSTKTYMVSMVGADGTKVEAVAVCHKDTSNWNPKSLPFAILKVKPGATPICHFLLVDQIAFFPSKQAA